MGCQTQRTAIYFLHPPFPAFLSTILFRSAFGNSMFLSLLLLLLLLLLLFFVLMLLLLLLLRKQLAIVQTSKNLFKRSTVKNIPPHFSEQDSVLVFLRSCFLFGLAVMDPTFPSILFLDSLEAPFFPFSSFPPSLGKHKKVQ